jgi:hypothetical protein
MDVSHPIRSVIPSVHGDVLAVLARTDAALTGRGVAGLVEGVSRAGVQKALAALVESGVVLVQHQPPANLYRLNRQHLAADAIVALATMRQRLLEAMRVHLASWDRPPWGAWLFGSAARADGSVASDIDVLIVRPREVTDLDAEWADDVDQFIADVTAWTGNGCAVIEYSRAEFDALIASDQRLARELRSDGIGLTDRRLPHRPAARAS